MPRAATAFRAALSLLLALLGAGILTTTASAAGPRIAAGAGHTCAITEDGDVQCWGRNFVGELGDGSVTPTTRPVTVTGLSDATAIAAGADHTCAIRELGGTVVCWGLNDNGQLGDGTTDSSAVPVAVDNINNAISISAGAEHTCIAKLNGQAFCWGQNDDGELGDGSTDSSSTAVQVVGLDDAISVAAGGAHTCAARNDDADGAVRCWGAGDAGQLGNGSTGGQPTPVDVTNLTDAVSVTAGFAHTCALLVSDEVRCWGDNTSGQLGDGTFDSSSTPVDVADLTDATAIDASAASPAAFAHTCARRLNRTVRCWGTGFYGELGGGDASDSVADVAGLIDASDVTAGSWHSCALRIAGPPTCWGLGDEGQLGNGRAPNATTPVAVSGAIGVTGITTGWASSCALRADGTVACWGAVNNTITETTSEGDLSATPAAVDGLSGVRDISSSADHTCVVRFAGTAACWGDGYYGQLGSAIDRSQTPVQVGGLTNAVAIGTGYSADPGRAFSCALRSTGEVSCWGANNLGQLGDGGVEETSSAPVDVSGIANATALAVGDSHACALLASQNVKCWGYGTSGQLGDGNAVTRPEPVDVGGLENVIAISAGGRHTCAIQSGGAAFCWGAGDAGQLGRGMLGDATSPVLVTGVTGATAIAAGVSHTCAVVAGGAVLCWGANGRGQLGTGNLADSGVAKPVLGVSGASKIDASIAHTCAVVGSAVRCWGDGRNGQLGDGYMPAGHRAVQLVPASVSGYPGYPDPTTPPATTPDPTTPAPSTPAATTPPATTPAPSTPAATTPPVTPPIATTPPVTPAPPAPPAPGPPVPTTPVATTPPVVKPTATAPSRVKPASLPKGFKVRITGASPRTRFTVTILIGSKTITTAKGRSSSRGRGTLTVRPSKQARQRLRGKRSMKLRITLIGPDGKTTKIVRTVKLR